MKVLERLRLLKAKAVDRMAELNALATKETRELSAVEKMEYDARKAEAEELAAAITEAEAELSAKPVATPPATPAAPKPDASAELKAATETEVLARVTTIRERMGAAKLPKDVAEKLEAELLKDGANVDKATARIFEEMAKQSAAQPDQRTGLAIQRGDISGRVENLAREVATREGLTRESAVVRVLNTDPDLYVDYLNANPDQTGHRKLARSR